MLLPKAEATLFWLRMGGGPPTPSTLFTVRLTLHHPSFTGDTLTVLLCPNLCTGHKVGEERWGPPLRQLQLFHMVVTLTPDGPSNSVR